MKRSIIIAMATLALVSCQTDDILDSNTGNGQNANNTAIRFDGEAGRMSRAGEDDAHTKLGDKFVVYGYKTIGNTKTTVYNHYNVEWKGTTPTSDTNRNGWEYVKIDKNPLNDGGTQTIKYWDYTASQYDFVAFSFGKATQGTGENEVEATKVDQETLSYTLSGKVSELNKCYIADRVVAKPSTTTTAYKEYSFNNCIGFRFRSLATRIKIAVYETIPGYSVKNLKFYTSSSETTGTETAPTLYAANATIPQNGDAKGKVKVSFDTDQQAKIELDETSSKVSTVKFGNLSLVEKEDQEKADGSEGTKIFIGRDANAASTSDYITTLPAANIGDLTLKVDFTLEATDGTGEDIEVKGATAVIPAASAVWKPNYAYTYRFKITQLTNGTTGGQALHPIYFDAVVAEEANVDNNGIIDADTDTKKN